MKKILVLLGLLLCAGCMRMIPFVGSSHSIDTSAVESGGKSLVVSRVQSGAGIPVESRWVNTTTGEEVKLSTHFLALTTSGAHEYDMVSVPPGTYVLTYLFYSRGSKVSWPFSPYAFSPDVRVSPLGQVFIEDIRETFQTVSTRYALRTRGLDADGKPIFASFTVAPGEVAYLGDLVVSYTPEKTGKEETGVFPAAGATLTVKDDLMRARAALEEEAPSLADRLRRIELVRGSRIGPQ